MPDEEQVMADLSDPTNWWTQAVFARAAQAEQVHRQGHAVAPDGVLAMALMHPERFEVKVALKEDGEPAKKMALTQEANDVFTAKDGTLFTDDGAAVMTYLDDALCQMHEEGEDDNPVGDALEQLLGNGAFLGRFLPGKQNGHSG